MPPLRGFWNFSCGVSSIRRHQNQQDQQEHSEGGVSGAVAPVWKCPAVIAGLSCATSIIHHQRRPSSSRRDHSPAPIGRRSNSLCGGASGDTFCMATRPRRASNQDRGGRCARQRHSSRIVFSRRLSRSLPFETTPCKAECRGSAQIRLCVQHDHSHSLLPAMRCPSRGGDFWRP